MLVEEAGDFGEDFLRFRDERIELYMGHRLECLKLGFRAGAAQLAMVSTVRLTSAAL